MGALGEEEQILPCEIHYSDSGFACVWGGDVKTLHKYKFLNYFIEVSTLT